MDDEVKALIAKMAARIDALERKFQKAEDDTIHFIESHIDRHIEQDKMIYSSYYRTHPEFCSSMDQFDKIFSGKSKWSDQTKS